ncbi:hypothetical protein THAOC_23827, partial [Thalassiosira oceanica]
MSTGTATDPDRVAVLGPDMRRVRAGQQAAAAERALAAEEERIAKAKAERERKRVMTPTEERFEKRGGEGTRLGDDGTKKEGGGSGVGRNGTAAGSSRSTGRRREPRAPPPGVVVRVVEPERDVIPAGAAPGAHDEARAASL